MLDMLNLIRDTPIEVIVGGVALIGMGAMFLYVALHPRDPSYHNDDFWN